MEDEIWVTIQTLFLALYRFKSIIKITIVNDFLKSLRSVENIIEPSSKILLQLGLNDIQSKSVNLKTKRFDILILKCHTFISLGTWRPLRKVPALSQSHSLIEFFLKILAVFRLSWETPKSLLLETLDHIFSKRRPKGDLIRRLLVDWEGTIIYQYIPKYN